MTYTGNRREASKHRQLSGFASLSKTVSTFEPLAGVVFKGSGRRIVTGPESNQVYCFSSHDPEQMIDARDAEALLKTGLFEIGS